MMETRGQTLAAGPATASLGERVCVERLRAGAWTCICAEAPTAFEPVRGAGEGFGIWLLEDAPLMEGDRLRRADGTRWLIRGAPLSGAGRGLMAVLTERER